MSLTNAKIVGLALTVTLVGGAAQAQTAASNASSYQSAYGANRNAAENAVNAATRDASGNAVQLDGQIATGTDNSIYANTHTLGAGDTYSGAGAIGGTTTVGSALKVLVASTSTYSTQTHNDAATAEANETAAGTASSLNGQVNLNGF